MMHEWGKYKDADSNLLSGKDIRAAIAAYNLVGRPALLMKLFRIDYDTAIALVRNEYVHGNPAAIK